MISYKAVVVGIDEDEACLKLKCGPGEDGCASCRLGSLCRGSESVEVRARVNSASRLRVGDTVELTSDSHLRYKAIAMLLLLPMVVILVAAFVADWLGVGSLGCATVALVSLVLTYAVVYLTYGRSGRDHDFKLVDEDK